MGLTCRVSTSAEQAHAALKLARETWEADWAAAKAAEEKAVSSS